MVAATRSSGLRIDLLGEFRVVVGNGAVGAEAWRRRKRSIRPGAPWTASPAGRWLIQHRPDVAAAHLERAESHVADRAEAGRLLRAKANLAWENGQISAARWLADQARDVALTVSTADVQAAVEEAVAIVSHFEGEWREGLEPELDLLVSASMGGVTVSFVSNNR
jgi:hypothetical protein